MDNGKPLPQYDNYALFSSDLLENRENLSTWKGPYLDYLQVQNTRRFHVSKTRFGIEPWTGLYQATILDWPVNSLSGCNIDNANCVEWIAVHADNQAEVNWLNDAFTKLDNYLDKNDGPSKGKIRRIDTSALDQRIYFQSFPRRRTF
ncbi:MAG: hypothetical protein GY793_03120 [Proteobacteria bacterium]|nr:hypothetical protein [Pseudomonadota bacterium]